MHFQSEELVLIFVPLLLHVCEFASLNTVIWLLEAQCKNIFGSLSIAINWICLKKCLIYFWLCWVFIALCRLSSCSEHGLLSSCAAQASRCHGFCSCGATSSSCGAWAQ